MSWLWMSLAGVTGSIVGGSGMLMMALASVRWHRITSFEGASGYFVIGLMLTGMIIGLLVGIGSARIVQASGRPEWWIQLLAAAIAVAVLVGIATLMSYLRVDSVPTHRGKAMAIEWEIRLPRQHTDRPDWPDAELRLQLVATRGGGRRPSAAHDAEFDRAAFRQEDGQWILPARAPVFTGRGVFCVNLTMGGRDDGFWPSFGPRPHAHDWVWSGWHTTNKSNGRPDADAVMYRYRFVTAEPLDDDPANTQQP